MEDKNILVFIEQRDSTYSDIKRAFKQISEADVRKVKTLVWRDGKKKDNRNFEGKPSGSETLIKIVII